MTNRFAKNNNLCVITANNKKIGFIISLSTRCEWKARFKCSFIINKRCALNQMIRINAMSAANKIEPLGNNVGEKHSDRKHSTHVGTMGWEFGLSINHLCYCSLCVFTFFSFSHFQWAVMRQNLCSDNFQFNLIINWNFHVSVSIDSRELYDIHIQEQDFDMNGRIFENIFEFVHVR